MDSLASVAQLARVLKGPLNFLCPEPEEIFRLVPNADLILPMPQRIYLGDENATPIVGFPVLASDGLEEVNKALQAYLQAEEVAQLAVVNRQATDRREVEALWERYRALLQRITENMTSSSYGRQFPGVFWLGHSLEVARWLKETPKRLVRLDATTGKAHGGSIKYQILFRYVDRVVAMTYDVSHRLATETDEAEQDIFPALLARMRDNVLVFSEDHISPDLAELGPYFAHYLSLDAKDYTFRLARLHEWHGHALRRDGQLQAAVRHLLGARAPEPRELLKRPGYLSFLATLPSYDSHELLGPQQVSVWESLLLKLKEYELFHGLRRLLVQVQRDPSSGRLAFRERSLNRTWAGPSWVEVSPTTRPLDFASPWVVDPQVDRFGLIYDLTEFSQIVSRLRRSGSEAQDRSFRAMFSFQRRVNTIARTHRLKLEKYLGDGAFYSAREAGRILATAVLIQRAYQEALAEGFPFDQGMRIGLNYGHYRLLPIEGDRPGAPDRYEFFGHGVVELSRLTTGKATREIQEIQTLLVTRGYSEDLVRRFFAPLIDSRADLIDKGEQARRFHAYLNANGHLVNEGIVGTGAFLERLSREPGIGRPQRATSGANSYIVAAVRDGDREVPVAFRKLGVVALKGLDPLAVYEIRDGGEWPSVDLRPLPLESGTLLEVIDRDYTRRVTGG
jgi:hypothetical protein